MMTTEEEPTIPSPRTGLIQNKNNCKNNRISYQSVVEQKDEKVVATSSFSSSRGMESIRQILDQKQYVFMQSNYENQLIMQAPQRSSSGVVARICLIVSVILMMIFIVVIHNTLPTEQEIELAHHYYGASILHNLPSFTTLELRNAQYSANQAQKDLLIIENDINNNEESNEYSNRRVLRNTNKNQKEEDKSKEKENNKPTKPVLRDGCESTVIIIRHCEKGSVTEHCAYSGYERSVYLASLFGNTTEERWPIPSAIFAESPRGRNNHHKMNFREIETVGPLAQKFNITVDDSYNDSNINKLTKSILRNIKSGDMCGRIIAIVWKHSRIAHIARQLGCGPAQGCPVDYSGKSFDQVWQIKFVYKLWEHSTNKHHFEIKPITPKWKIFGSVQYEHFDPLAVSKQFGDYPSIGGTTISNGQWQKLTYSYPERHHITDTAGWQMSRVGFENIQRPPPSTTTTTGNNNNNVNTDKNNNNK